MRFEKAIALMDEKNKQDSNKTIFEGQEYPKEYIYGVRMSEKLEDFMPEAPEALKLAARCQHICRWEIARNTFPAGKVGYLNWRNELKNLHAKIAEEILLSVGYENDIIEMVKFLLKKKQLKKNELTQALEDVICLVFLEFYYDDFLAKHTEEKIIDILQKTWVKMSDKAHQAALKLSYSEEGLALVQKALA